MIPETSSQYQEHRNNNEVLEPRRRDLFQKRQRTPGASLHQERPLRQDGKRAWRNTGQEALVFLVIQARAGSLAQSDISDGEIMPGEVVWS